MAVRAALSRLDPRNSTLRVRARARLALRHGCLRCHAETKSPVGPYSQQVELCGARAVPIVWTVRDNKGELLPRFISGSRREVARKVVTTRYDAFRLEVSASYREQFDRDLKTVLARHDWQIVPLKRRTRAHRRNEAQLELNAPLSGGPPLVKTPRFVRNRAKALRVG